MTGYYKEPSKNMKTNMTDDEFINKVNNKDNGTPPKDNIPGARDNETFLYDTKPKPLGFK